MKKERLKRLLWQAYCDLFITLEEYNAAVKQYCGEVSDGV